MDGNIALEWPHKSRSMILNSKCPRANYKQILILYEYVVGLVQERRNSSANALELRLSCTNPLMCDRCLTNVNLGFFAIWDIVSLKYSILCIERPWVPTIYNHSRQIKYSLPKTLLCLDSYHVFYTSQLQLFIYVKKSQRFDVTYHSQIVYLDWNNK